MMMSSGPAVKRNPGPGGTRFITSMTLFLSPLGPIKLNGDNSDKYSVLLRPTCSHASRHTIVVLITAL